MRQQTINQTRLSWKKVPRHTDGPVVYWMSREQRVHDNWTLLAAQEYALAHKKPLIVFFCVLPTFLSASLRQYDFFLRGLLEVEQTLHSLHIPFLLTTGDPVKEIAAFCAHHRVESLFCDWSPLRGARKSIDAICATTNMGCCVVDARNIVPHDRALDKKAYSAAVFRRRIAPLLFEYLTDFPRVQTHPYASTVEEKKWDPQSLISILHIPSLAMPVEWIVPGPIAANKQLDTFLEATISRYEAAHNDPNAHASSLLSPYIHFGQISAQRIAYRVQKESKRESAAFLEQLIVRRELAENFCTYEPNYDSVDAFPNWAKNSLEKHKNDPREYTYSPESLRDAATHDPLWNAAQRELVHTGYMHGYMRMYWAKKILEWTKTAQDALSVAIELNDQYQLDGRDPNGYAGIAWSIGAVHDRPMRERPIFGIIRYMNQKGCARKFDIQSYTRRYSFV